MEKKDNVTIKLICNNLNCDAKDCVYHHNTLQNYSTDHKVSAHLEENPLYCKKSNWNRNQYQY